MYNQSQLSQASLASMLEVANRIWRPYGISIDGGPSADGVTVVVSPSTLPSDPSGAVLGTTLFAEGHATPYVRLWLGAAEIFAGDADADRIPFNRLPPEQHDAVLAQIMGVALAHELGHYLLDTARHSPRGLLRTRLRLHDVQDLDRADLSLTQEQQRLFCPDVTIGR